MSQAASLCFDLIVSTARIVTTVLQLGLCGCAAPSLGSAERPERCSSAPNIEQLVEVSSIDRADNSQLALNATSERKQDEQWLQVVYTFERTAPEQHFSLTFTLAPAGRFIQEQDFRERRREAEARGTNLALEFPPIGLRAAHVLLGFGPGGAAESLTFTTTDGRFDIRVVQSNLMPEGVDSPTVDLRQLASALEQRYRQSSSATAGCGSL